MFHESRLVFRHEIMPGKERTPSDLEKFKSNVQELYREAKESAEQQSSFFDDILEILDSSKMTLIGGMLPVPVRIALEGVSALAGSEKKPSKEQVSQKIESAWANIFENMQGVEKDVRLMKNVLFSQLFRIAFNYNSEQAKSLAREYLLKSFAATPAQKRAFSKLLDAVFTTYSKQSDQAEVIDSYDALARYEFGADESIKPSLLERGVKFGVEVLDKLLGDKIKLREIFGLLPEQVVNFGEKSRILTTLKEFLGVKSWHELVPKLIAILEEKGELVQQKFPNFPIETIKTILDSASHDKIDIEGLLQCLRNLTVPELMGVADLFWSSPQSN